MNADIIHVRQQSREVENDPMMSPLYQTIKTSVDFEMENRLNQKDESKAQTYRDSNQEA